MKSKRQIKTLRWLFSCLAFFSLFYLVEYQDKTLNFSSDEPAIFSNQAHDDLEKLYIQALQEAKESILLVIYSLNDQKLINLLNQKAEDSLAVNVFYDPSTPQKGFQKLSEKIHKEPLKPRGLMHQKILVTDDSKVWIGSANWTRESLKLHDNLVVLFKSRLLAEAIRSREPRYEEHLGNQEFEFYSLPQAGKEACEKLMQLIDGAKKTVKVAMYTLTHSELTNRVISAHKRGVKVEVILDRGQAGGVSHKVLKSLQEAHVPVRLNTGMGLLHHKFLLIDDELLAQGSTNWTQAAFSRNMDCFTILSPLTETQKKKMEKVWHALHSQSQPPIPTPSSSKKTKTERML